MCMNYTFMNHTMSRLSKSNNYTSSSGLSMESQTVREEILQHRRKGSKFVVHQRLQLNGRKGVQREQRQKNKTTE